MRSGVLDRLAAACARRRPARTCSAVHLDGVAARVTTPVPPRVVEDGIEPRAQVRPALELPRVPERLDERILDEILRVGAVPRQPHRRGEERLEELERLGGKIFRVRGG
mgnify:CR=1 FL=1